MKSLDIPDADILAMDPRAVELVRFWVGADKCHVALNIGVWHDATDSDLDERAVWSNVIADITKHVANAMEQRYGTKYDSTVAFISKNYTKALRLDANLEGN